MSDFDRREACAPFADPMLKLAVLEALSRQGLVLPPMTEPLDEWQLDETNLDRLLAIPLSAEQLASITMLRWERGGMSVQSLVFFEHGGDDDTFVIRDLSGIEALTSLRELQLSPFGHVPDAQLDALRARGVRIVDLDPAPVAQEPIVLYRLAELPAGMADAIPPGSAPWDCIFYVAADESPALDALAESVPERDLDHADEASDLAERVAACVGAASTALGTQHVSSGFHAAPAEETMRFFRSQPVAVLTLDECFARCALLEVWSASGKPQKKIALRARHGGEDDLYESVATGHPGLFVVDAAVFEGAERVVLVSGKHEQELYGLRAGAFVRVEGVGR